MRDATSTYLELAGPLDHPLFIVTASDRDRREGCVIGFATQCSVHPPRFLACLSRENRTFRPACDVDALAVHLSRARGLSSAGSSAAGPATRSTSSPAARGIAARADCQIVDACPSWFAGTICARHHLGDHIGFLLDPFDAQFAPGDAATSFRTVKDAIEPGHPIT